MRPVEAARNACAMERARGALARLLKTVSKTSISAENPQHAVVTLADSKERGPPIRDRVLTGPKCRETSASAKRG